MSYSMFIIGLSLKVWFAQNFYLGLKVYSIIQIHFRLPRVGRTFQYRNICAKALHFDSFSKPPAFAPCCTATSDVTHMGSRFDFFVLLQCVRCRTTQQCDRRCFIKLRSNKYLRLLCCVVIKTCHPPTQHTHQKYSHV